MSFYLGERSCQRLEGVNTRLVAVVARAIHLAERDFAVIEGLRTRERQRTLVASGASQTLNSKHLTGDAVDLAPYVAGRIEWAGKFFYPVADAVRDAARLCRVTLRWGGCWETLNDIEDTRAAVAAYATRRKAEGRDPFIDLAHYELMEG